MPHAQILLSKKYIPSLFWYNFHMPDEITSIPAPVESSVSQVPEAPIVVADETVGVAPEAQIEPVVAQPEAPSEPVVPTPETPLEPIAEQTTTVVAEPAPVQITALEVPTNKAIIEPIAESVPMPAQTSTSEPIAQVIPEPTAVGISSQVSASPEPQSGLRLRFYQNHGWLMRFSSMHRQLSGKLNLRIYGCQLTNCLLKVTHLSMFVSKKRLITLWHYLTG